MLKAGASRVRLTLPSGTSMAGYAARTGPATGAHDDLYARALVLSADGLTVGLIVVDALLLAGDFVQEVRDTISTVTNLDRRHIVVATTHTHAGPGGLVSAEVCNGLLSKAAGFLGPPDATLQASLKSALLLAVQQALADLRDVLVGVGVGHAPGVGANRRTPDGFADHDVVVVRFDSLDGRGRALLFSQACHPTVLGPDNSLFSGGLVGLASQALEADSDSLVALGMTGAAGDVSTRYTRREQTFAEAEHLASLLVDAVHDAVAQLTPVDDNRLSLKCAQVALPAMPPSSRAALERRLAAAHQALAEARRQEVSTSQLRQIESVVEGIEFQMRALEPSAPVASIPAEVCALRVGPAILCAFPVELFAKLGLTLRQAVGADRTLVACYANDYLGYAPTHLDYEKGGYEVDMALLAPGCGERLVAFALSLLKDTSIHKSGFE